MVVELPIEGIMLAKAESGEEIRCVDWVLGLLEEERQLPAGRLVIISFDEIAWAQKVVDIFTRARAEGAGVIQMDGKIVELPMLRRAQQILFRKWDLGIGISCKSLIPVLI